MPKQLRPKKLGIIAGSGELPKQVISACKKQGRDYFVIGFEGITAATTIKNTPHKLVHIGKVGATLKTLKSEGVKEVLMAGRVGRPPLSSLKTDFGALKLITEFRKLKSQGDDKIFTTIIKFIEKSGFKVIGADDVLKDLLISKETVGTKKPDRIALNDIEVGKKTALEIGKLDIGQAVIVQMGQILGVEGPEGTDNLVKRCKSLHSEGPGGVLVKMKKPGQDARVDLPSIGVSTIENAHKSGLRGIAVEAGGALVINRDKVKQKADELGLFVIGIK